MKRVLFALMSYLCCHVAFAFDYNVGQVPCVGCSAFGSQPANWEWGSSGGGYGGNIKSSPFADTMTFSLGNWTESYGTYEYTKSDSFDVFGAVHSGHYGSMHTVVTITTATLDGVPLTQSSPGHFLTPISLAPGSHTVAVTGTADCTNCSSLNYATWDVNVNGILYNLVPNPPPTGDGVIISEKPEQQ